MTNLITCNNEISSCRLTFMNSTILSASRTLTSNLNSPFTKYLTVGYPFTLKRDPISGSFVASNAASTPEIYEESGTKDLESLHAIQFDESRICR